MQKEQSEINKKAWSYRAFEWWEKKSGSPKDAAEDIKRDPEKYLRKHIGYMGDVKGKRIAVLLGSNGRKAIPLALLGGSVTIVDISPENQRYALEVAREVGVEIEYIVSDVFEIDLDRLQNTYDIVYLECGILHYFADLAPFARIVYDLLKDGGRLVLNDFHPIRKFIRFHSDHNLAIKGDYFDTRLFRGDVAYKSMFPLSEQSDFPDCLLRYWNMGEIVSAVAASGLVIDKLIEEPRSDENHFLPGSFTLVANKFKVDKNLC
jgi:SAM-dependent methyltransferase